MMCGIGKANRLSILIWFLALCLGAVAGPALTGTSALAQSSGDPRLSGGDTTIFDVTSAAFEIPAPNLTDEELVRHIQGDAAFDAAFVSAPAPIFSGLGPIFNNTACSACHPGNGRGEPAAPDNLRPPTMFLRLSLPGADAVTGAPLAVPGFGFQLQHRALFGVQPEAQVQVAYSESTESFEDGTEIQLRRPDFAIVESYLPMPEGVLTSPRVAPPVFGRGLLEAIDEATLVGYADELDRDGDGISGRPNIVWDFLAQVPALGRFGWKANNPNLVQQNAGAYTQDMGVTNPYFPAESATDQAQSDGRSDEPEIDQETLDVTVFYVQTLAVPARRDIDDPIVQRGEEIFTTVQCAACHIPRLQTGTLPGLPGLSNQTIYPYTDLLLHDMGEGLADGRPDYLATGQEWRTPPLWGIGLTERVSGRRFFLHDGRARNLLEAMMWHGGEAAAAREQVRRLSQADRQALLAFLESL